MKSKRTIKAIGAFNFLEGCISRPLKTASVVLSELNGIFKRHNGFEHDPIAPLLFKGDKRLYYAVMRYRRNWFRLVDGDVFNHPHTFIFNFQVRPFKFLYEDFLKPEGVSRYHNGIFDLTSVLDFCTHRLSFPSANGLAGTQPSLMSPNITMATTQ